MNNLKEKVIHGISWSLGARVFQQLSSFIITAFLARLLSPDDFGLVGMVTVFTGFATIFAQLGLSAALVQNQNIDDRHYSSAFLLNIVSGSLITVLFILVSPFIAAFYNKPQLQPLIFALSFNFIISSFGIVHKAVLTKKMDFKKLTLIEAISTVCGGTTGVILAFRGFGVWSLIFQMLAFASANMLLLWILSPFRIKFIYSIDAIKDIFSFSVNLTGFNIVNYFARNIDYLLIGKFLGAEALGYYTLAYKLMMYPLRNISQVIGQVMYPAFSQIQYDLEKVKVNYLKMTKAISIVTFPMLFGIIAITPEFINNVFGEKWTDSIIIIRILCICGLFQSIHNISGTIILALGKADLQLKLGIFSTIFAVIAIIIGLQWGIVGVAMLYTIEQILWIITAQYIVNKLILLKNITFYFNFMKVFIFSISMMFFVFLTKSLNFTFPLNLIIYINVGILFYLFSAILLLFLKNKKINLNNLLETI